MTQDTSSISLNGLPKDIAKIIKGYLGQRWFAFSSINRKFRAFFEEERKYALGRVKIMVKEHLDWSMLFTFDGKLYVCGTNGAYLLGLEYDHEDLRQWTEIGFEDKKIDEVVCGKHRNNFFVRCGKEWYGVGLDYSEGEIEDYGNTGSRTEYPVRYFAPLKEVENKRILKVINGFQRFFIYCEDERWYGCGENREGQLDPSSTCKIIKEWIEIKPSSHRVFHIISTFYNTFVHSEDGWYGCGTNHYGQLGVGVVSPNEQWRSIGPAGKRVTKLVANDENTVIYCDDGYWYGCGSNDYGQLGTGDRTKQSSWVRLGPAGKAIKGVWLCERRIFISCTEGLYTAGYSHIGGIARPNAEDILNWTNIGFEHKTLINILGHSEETYIHCSDGWYAKGENFDGQFGMEGNQTSEWIKLECEGKPVQELVPGTNHVFACTEDAWYVAGSNDNGQNGRGEWRTKCPTWLKVISHNQTMAEVLSFLANKKQHASKSERRSDFRAALKKLYEQNIVEKIVTAAQISIHALGEISLCIYYNENDSHFPEVFYFSLYRPGWQIEDYEEERVECMERIAQLIEYEYTDGVQLILNDSEENILPPGSRCVVLSAENHPAFLDFLKNYELALDKYMLSEQEPVENLLPAGEPEHKKFKSDPDNSSSSPEKNITNNFTL